MQRTAEIAALRVRQVEEVFEVLCEHCDVIYALFDYYAALSEGEFIFGATTRRSARTRRAAPRPHSALPRGSHSVRTPRSYGAAPCVRTPGHPQASTGTSSFASSTTST